MIAQRGGNSPASPGGGQTVIAVRSVATYCGAAGVLRTHHIILVIYVLGDTMRYFKELDFLSPFEDVPTLRPPLERKDSDFARVSATLDRIEKHRERVESEFRDPVSSKYKYIDPYLDELKSFADRLIAENVRKQAEPDIVARRVNKFNRDLLKEVGLRSPRLRPGQPGIDKSFSTAWVGSKRVDEIPRTVFGNDAWIGRAVGRRFVHAMHLNPRFVTRLLALPCVERQSRREVMFANKKAGHGYRVRHRRHKFSDIWC